MTLPPVPRPPTETPHAPAAPSVGARGGRGTVTALISTCVLALALAAGLVAVSVVALTQDDDTDLSALEERIEQLAGAGGPFLGEDDWNEYDELYGFEDAYVVDDDDVFDATEDACSDLQATAAALPLLGAADPLQPLTDVRDAVAAIVAGVDSVEDLDADSEEWRDDVALLLEQLDDALVELSAGAEPELDFAAGDDIAMRMYWGSPVGCEPPLRLLALDPDYAPYEDTYSYVS